MDDITLYAKWTANYGWHLEDGVWYFYNSDGTKYTGWIHTTDGSPNNTALYWYYLDEAGKPKTGWVLDDGKWYYLRPDWGGALLEGDWLWDNDYGGWFYLRSDWGGAMAANEWILTDGSWYYVGPDGKMIKNTKTPDGYWVDNTGRWDGKSAK